MLSHGVGRCFGASGLLQGKPIDDWKIDDW
jgi:hypothetical protein